MNKRIPRVSLMVKGHVTNNALSAAAQIAVWAVLGAAVVGVFFFFTSGAPSI